MKAVLQAIFQLTVRRDALEWMHRFLLESRLNKNLKFLINIHLVMVIVTKLQSCAGKNHSEFRHRYVELEFRNPFMMRKAAGPFQ